MQPEERRAADLNYRGLLKKLDASSTTSSAGGGGLGVIRTDSFETSPDKPPVKKNAGKKIHLKEAEKAMLRTTLEKVRLWAVA